VALRRTVEGLGLTVHTGVGTQRITTGADGRADGMELSDGSRLATDMVVFSAGVRPRDELARACGLPVGERGGIAVDVSCRTADPAVFAIGECALAADGRVYGLVAPGNEMAETAARAIAGEADGSGGFTGADRSTKLKLLGVDVASFGDAHGTTDGCLDVSYADARSGIYRKLVVGADGTLLGGVLVGDVESYGVLRPLTGTVPPIAPEHLVLPAGAGAPVALGPGALPDEAVICSCHNVSKGAIRGAVTEHSCGTVPEVKKCTKAGTGCGSCVKVLGQLVNAELEANGVTVDKGLCPCFGQTRAELYEIGKNLPTGIAANVAVFSVADAVLFRPAAFPHPDRVVAFETQSPAGLDPGASPIMYQHWRAQTSVVEEVTAFRNVVVNETSAATPEIKPANRTAFGPPIRLRRGTTARQATAPPSKSAP